MKTKNKLYLVILSLLNLIVCNGCSACSHDEMADNTIHICRFDRDMFQYVLMDNPEQQKRLIGNYPKMLKVLGITMFNTRDTQSDEFFAKLANYYSEPNLNKLYRDALTKYESVGDIETNLGKSFGCLRELFPDMQIPAVYMHVSGFNQNVLVDDSLLSISIDKYLGADYAPYVSYNFDDYQRRRMDPTYIVPDYITAWLISEFPFDGNDKVLLERMIYEGKIRYLLHQAMPQMIPEVLMGYSSEEYQWCKQNESGLWKLIIERQHLYTPDLVTTAKYFLDRPSTFISEEAPGNLGSWMGWQIVTKYMEKTKVSAAELMNNKDAQDILTKSKYKP